MGYIANDGDIIVDAVLTSLGRELLSRMDGSFEVVRYGFADDEINYILFNPSVGSTQQDANIVNTPIFEASTNEAFAFKYPLVSVSNPDLKYLPTLNPSANSLTLGERTDSQVGKSVEFKQATQSGRIVPAEIIDASFMIQINGDLLFIEKQTPVTLTPDGVYQYVIPRTSIASNQGAVCSFNIAVQALTADIWDTLGIGVVGSRTISTIIRCQGALSGLQGEVTVTISEEFTR